MKKILLAISLLLLLASCAPKELLTKDETIPEIPTPTQNTESSSTPESTPIPDKAPDKIEYELITFGDSFTFSGFTINISDAYEIFTIDDEWSSHNGKEIIKIPVHIKNNSGETGSLNFMYFNTFGIKGTQQESIIFSVDNDWLNTGDMRNGAEVDAFIHMEYEGDGDYFIEMDDWSTKGELKFSITKA